MKKQHWANGKRTITCSMQNVYTAPIDFETAHRLSTASRARVHTHKPHIHVA